MGAESGSLNVALCLCLDTRSTTVDCTFPPSLPRSVGTSHISPRLDQVLPRLSSSVKISNGET